MFKIFRKYPEIFFAISEKKDGSMKLLKNIGSDHSNLRNRKIYFQKIGVPFSRLVSAETIHKNKVAVVSKNEAKKTIKGADGLVTGKGGVYLSITSADCLPVFLFDSQKKIVGMIHAGWRGLETDILANTIKKIKELGGTPEKILVGIGPAICQSHYEIGPEVAKKFAKYSQALKKENRRIFLDIRKVAELQLLELGLREENLETSPECTYELPEKYYSARRDKSKEVKAMMAVVGLKK
jgi:hypothetical protein